MQVLLRLTWLALIGLATAQDWDTETPLDTYVNTPDPNYRYDVIQTFQETDATVYILNMTSQKWFDESLTSTPIWWHYMTVVIPDNLIFTDSALLYITGGNMDDLPPDLSDGNLQRTLTFSRNTGAVSASLRMVPNQPLYFTYEDNRPRSEDAIIAYTWKLFLTENVTDPNVLALFPMTKAAKAAVDTLINLTSTVDARLNIDKVMPTGFSKRGWTTWLLACVDRRVFAAAPVVYDLLNFYKNIQHQFQSLNGWSWAFTSYWLEEIPSYLHDPRSQILIQYQDPLEYNPRLTMPKLVTCGTADQFFLADDAMFFWNQLNGPKYYVIYENDDHSLGDHRDILWANYEAFFISVRNNVPLPTYGFSIGEDQFGGYVTLNSTTVPNWVRGWSADTTNRTCVDDDPTNVPCRRDFRKQRFEIPTATLIEWYQVPVADLGSGSYQLSQNYRTDFGFKTFHIEVSYPAPGSSGEIRLTTIVNVLDNWLPYPICVTPEQCQGQLV